MARPVTILLGLILVVLVLPGQVFGQDDPVPDTLDWRRYFPLEVGNQWHYETSSIFFPDPPPFFDRWRVVGDSLVEDKNYFLFETCSYDEALVLTDCATHLLRYDTTHANVVARRTLADGQVRDEWFGPAPCGLDAPFNAMHTCSGVDRPTAYYVGGGSDETFTIGADTIMTAAWKGFSGGTEHEEFWVADIGLLEQGTGEFGAPVTRLVYAVVGGVKYGEMVLPTAVEEKNALPVRFAITAFYPNPFHHVATVRYQVPQAGPVRAEVYTLLGQRLLLVNLGYRASGVHQLSLRGDDLPAGTYYLRLIRAHSQTTRVFTVIK